MEISDRIKAARKQNGLTQKQLADKLEVAEITIRQYESGKRSPKTDMLLRIADTLRVPIFYFIDPAEYNGSDEYKLANEEWKKAKLEFCALDGLLDILADIYGCYEERRINGEHGFVNVHVFGKGENAFALEGDSIHAILQSIKGSIPPIVEMLGQKVEDVAKAYTDFK